MRARLEEAEDTLRAIRTGEVDALMVLGPTGEQAFTLKGADEPYRVIVESMTEGAVTCSADGTVLYCNAGFAAMLHKPLEQLIGSTILGYIQPCDRIAFKSLLARSLQTADKSHIRIRSGPETTIPMLCSTSVIKVGMRECIVAVFTDLSKVFEAEEAESRLSMLVESSDDAIVGTSLDGVVESWNSSAEKLFEYTKSEAIGRKVQFLIVPPDQTCEIMEKLRKARQGKGSKTLDTVRRRKDGSQVHVSVSSSAVLDINGTPVGMSLVFRDISELREHEDKVKQLNAKLEQRVLERTAQLAAANKELESFSYSVSHDLRAPLRSLSGFSRIVLEEHGKNLDEDGKACLQRISAAAEKMSVLIDEILRLSRIGRTQIKFAKCDLTEMAESTIAEFIEQSRDRHVDVRIQRDLRCEGDRHLLLIALQNLLGNAWKFTEKRSDAQIEFGCTSKDGEKVYYVRDNGAGFDMAYADKLFGIFQRLHSNSEFEGVGIGLSIVKRVIERHNGRVWAEGAVDKGATFYFTLGPESRD